MVGSPFNSPIENVSKSSECGQCKNKRVQPATSLGDRGRVDILGRGRSVNLRLFGFRFHCDKCEYRMNAMSTE